MIEALQVQVPSNDGASYLSMVEAFARGDWGQGFSYVFPPGNGILVAPLAALTGDSLLAFAIMGSLCAALGILSLGLAARHWLHPKAGLFAAALLAFLSLSVRSAGEAYSEAFFVPLLCVLLLALARRRKLLAGLLLGLGFWLRPEALAFFPLLFQGGHPSLVSAAARRRAAWGLGLGLLVALALPLARLNLAALPDPLPKFHLMKGMGPLGAAGFSQALGLFGNNLVRVPWALLRGLDFGIPLLAILGIFGLARKNPGLARALGLSLFLATCAQLFFQVKPRFFVDQAPLWILASVGMKSFKPLLFAIALLPSGLRVVRDLWSPPRIEKRAELLVGRLLRREGIHQGQLLTDMPRVAWAAGLMPAPPLIWTPENLRAAIQVQRPRHLVLGARRPGRLEIAAWAQSMGVPLRPPFRLRTLPVSIRDRVGGGRILWLEQKR